MTASYWVCAGITLVSAAVSFGFALAGLRAADASARTPSRYALSRSIALLAVAAVALFSGSVPFVAAIAIVMIVVQAIDAVVGAFIPDRIKTIGPAVTALVNLGALVWLFAA